MTPDGSPWDDPTEMSHEGSLRTQGTVADTSLARSSPEKTQEQESGRQSSPAKPNVPEGIVTSTSIYLVEGSAKPYAEGAMGTILLAQDERLGRTVVLKILHEKHRDNPGLRQRFLREAAITAQLQHPGVPPVFSVGSVSDARPFFSMKLVEGRTLEQLLLQCVDQARERARFLTIFEQICQTVAFAHARGIIHRDLKPSNIVVGDYGSVYVMDWGLAGLIRQPASEAQKPGAGARELLSTEETMAIEAVAQCHGTTAQDSSITILGNLMGTPQYMSPEQAAGYASLDERSDVFSLGAILFEILTGAPLRPATIVSRNDLECFVEAYVTTTLPALDTCTADAPVVTLARRCLDPDPGRRPASAAEVAAGMTAYLLHVLQRPEREMARFFELSLDLFCLAGLDGYFKQINKNFTRVLGFSTEEMLARPFIEYVHADDRDQTRDQVVKLSQGLPVVQFENRYRDRWGNYKWFEWTAKSVPEEGIIFAVAREITGRKHLEHRLESIVESFPAGLVVIDHGGVIRLVNKQTERLFGYSRNELVARRLDMLISSQCSAHDPPSQGPSTANLLECTAGQRHEIVGWRKDGTELSLEIELNPIETGERVLVVTAVLDFTRKRRD